MSWQKVKLKEVLKQYRVQHIVQDDIEYKQVSILNDGSVVLRGSKIGKEIGRKRQFIIDLNTYPDTLIFTRQLLLQGSIGIASEDVNECIVTENMPMFSIQTSKIDKDFLILFLKSEVFKSRIRKIELSGSAQKSIHEKTFLELEFHIPKIEEQKQIVVELLKLKSKSNSISTEITHQLDLIKQLRQAFLREAMQGKLCHAVPTLRDVSASQETGQDLLAKIKAEKAQLIAEKKLKKEKELPPITEAEIPFDIPKHWTWCRLGEIAEVKRGKSPKYSENGVFRMLNQKCVRWFFIDTQYSKAIDEKWFNSITNDLKLKTNDLLVNSTGDGTIGRSGIVDSLCEEFMFDSHILRVRSFLEINQNLLCFIINSEYGQSLIESIKGATSTKQTELGVNNLSSFPIPLPPLKEQEQIVANLEELMAFCDGLEQSIKESQGYNEKLLQQVLREALQGNEVEV